MHVQPSKELWEVQNIGYCCLYSVPFNFPINSAWKIENIYSVHVLCFSSDGFYYQNVQDTCRLYYCSKGICPPETYLYLYRVRQSSWSAYKKESQSVTDCLRESQILSSCMRKDQSPEKGYKCTFMCAYICGFLRFYICAYKGTFICAEDRWGSSNLRGSIPLHFLMKVRTMWSTVDPLQAPLDIRPEIQGLFVP